jgi:hypothetical protein
MGGRFFYVHRGNAHLRIRFGLFVRAQKGCAEPRGAEAKLRGAKQRGSVVRRESENPRARRPADCEDLVSSKPLLPRALFESVWSFVRLSPAYEPNQPHSAAP